MTTTLLPTSLLLSFVAFSNSVFYQTEQPNRGGPFAPVVAKQLWKSISDSINSIPTERRFGPRGSEAWSAQPVPLRNGYIFQFTAGLPNASAPSSLSATQVKVQLANIYLDMLYKYMNETEKARFQQRLHVSQFLAQQQPQQRRVSAPVSNLGAVLIHSRTAGYSLRPRQIPSGEGFPIGGHWLRNRENDPRPELIGQGGDVELEALGVGGVFVNERSIRTQLSLIAAGEPDLGNNIVLAWEKGVFLKYTVTRSHTFGSAVHYVEHPNPGGQYSEEEAEEIWVAIGRSIYDIPRDQEFGPHSESWNPTPVRLSSGPIFKFVAGVAESPSRNGTELQVELSNLYLDMLYKFMDQDQADRFGQQLHTAQSQARLFARGDSGTPRGRLSDIRALFLPQPVGDEHQMHGTAAGHVTQLRALGAGGGDTSAETIDRQLTVIGNGRPNLHNDIVNASQNGVFLKYEVRRSH